MKLFSRIQVLDKSGMIAQHLKSTDRISYEIINEDNTQTIKSNLKKRGDNRWYFNNPSIKWTGAKYSTKRDKTFSE